jgi:cell division septal protein FtsQ
MAKKKKKRNSKGKGFAALGSFFSQSFKYSLKVVPSVVVIFILSTVFLGVRQALYADPNLNVQKIIVEPSDALAPTQRERLENNFLGKNILQVNIQDVAEHLQKDPQIESAKVIKQLPSSLKIEVSRRKPLAYARFTANGNYALVSEDGMILESVPASQVTGPTIEAFGLGLKEPVISYQIRNRGFHEIVKFMKAYQDHPFAKYEKLTKVSLDHLGNVTITLGDGPAVHLGRRPSERLSSFEKILPILEGEGRAKIDYIDLEFDNVIVKQKGTASKKNITK